MGQLYLEYEDETDEVYVCRKCGTHLTSPSEIVSKVSILKQKVEWHFSYSCCSPSTARLARLTFSTRCKSSFAGVQLSSHARLITVTRMNVQTGPPEDKALATGLHQVRDIYCKQCLTIVGWTYVSVSPQKILNLIIGKAVVFHPVRENFCSRGGISDGLLIFNRGSINFIYENSQNSDLNFLACRTTPTWSQRSTRKASP